MITWYGEPGVIPRNEGCGEEWIVWDGLVKLEFTDIGVLGEIIDWIEDTTSGLEARANGGILPSKLRGAIRSAVDIKCGEGEVCVPETETAFDCPETEVLIAVDGCLMVMVGDKVRRCDDEGFFIAIEWCILGTDGIQTVWIPKT